MSRKQNLVMFVCIGFLVCLLWLLLGGIRGNRLFAYPAPIQSENSQESNLSSLSGYPGPATPTPDAVQGYPGPTGSDPDDDCWQSSGSQIPETPDPCATPIPLPTPTATPEEPVPLHVTTLLTFQPETELVPAPVVPVAQWISPSEAELPNVQLDAVTLTYNGPLPTGDTDQPLNQPAADLVDNWDLLFEEDFEGIFPDPGCVVFDNNSGEEQFWDKDDHRPLEGSYAGWPAKGGANGVDPANTNYPSNLDSWLVCGPYDLSQADNFMVEFDLWLEIGDAADSLAVLASADGSSFTGFAWTGTSDWFKVSHDFPSYVGDSSVWMALQFSSDDDLFNLDEGAWVDNLEVWRYNTPSAVCGNFDPGNKGLLLPSYDPTTNGEAPMIRPGDVLAVEAMKAAGVHWVRLGFIHKNGSIDVRAFDRMVDTLCAEGMSVLGLVNHESMIGDNYDDPATAEAYREEFANLAGYLAGFYQGRITYWEVWNEQNFLEGAFIDPIRYAPLLDDTYQAINAANPQAQVLFGGLASAWGDSNLYFNQVYDNSPGTRQFDYFAVHPYANETYGPNPEIYMYADLLPGEVTIVDKFMNTMSTHTQGNKHVWVTEVGWNSAKDLPNRPVEI